MFNVLYSFFSGKQHVFPSHEWEPIKLTKKELDSSALLTEGRGAAQAPLRMHSTMYHVSDAMIGFLLPKQLIKTKRRA